MKTWIKKQFRKKTRIYIMPTKMGGYLNGLIFLMFLLSVGYANNLLLIFTTFLFTFNLLWLIQTHFHLHRLKFEQMIIYPGHANQLLPVNVLWSSTPKGPWNWDIELESDQGQFTLLSSIDELSKTMGEIRVPKRGVYRWQYLKVKSINPFGLYQAWIFHPLKEESLVYPPLLAQVEVPLSGKEAEGELLQDRKGHDDFRGLATYEQDESRKISWKHYARSGELFIKEGEEQKAAVFDLELVVPHDHETKEDYLSYVATQLVECSRRGIPFSLKVNGVASGQLHDCLKVLALC